MLLKTTLPNRYGTSAPRAPCLFRQRLAPTAQVDEDSVSMAEEVLKPHRRSRSRSRSVTRRNRRRGASTGPNEEDMERDASVEEGLQQLSALAIGTPKGRKPAAASRSRSRDSTPSRRPRRQAAAAAVKAIQQVNQG